MSYSFMSHSYKKGPIIHHIFGGGIIILVLETVYMVLVLGQPKSTPKIVIL